MFYIEGLNFVAGLNRDWHCRGALLLNFANNVDRNSVSAVCIESLIRLSKFLISISFAL